MIRIVLAGEPKGKGRPRFVRATGRTYTPEATRSYESELRWVGQIEMGQHPPLEGQLSVTVTARMGIPKSMPKKKIVAALEGRLRPTRKPDVDNVAKCLDALNKIVWNDDAQIVVVRVVKVYSEKPELEITVEELTDLF